MCKHCGHAHGDHWREDNKCAVKDCRCPGYETPDQERAERKKQLTTWLWSVAVAALTSPLFFLFDSVGKSGTGRAAWLSAIAILLAMKVRWELRKYVWFWLTMACIVGANIPLVLFVPWTSRWIPAVGLLPIVIADIAGIFGCLHLVEKWRNPNSSSKQGEVASRVDIAN
jgi:hypothetical protein